MVRDRIGELLDWPPDEIDAMLERAISMLARLRSDGTDVLVVGQAAGIFANLDPHSEFADRLMDEIHELISTDPEAVGVYTDDLQELTGPRDGCSCPDTDPRDGVLDGIDPACPWHGVGR